MSVLLNRREMLTMAAAGLASVKPALSGTAPASPVAIARCRSYDARMYEVLKKTLNQVDGLGKLVRGKTVAVKLNLTGQLKRFPVKAELPYRTDPATALATVQLLANAGAKRIRILESMFPVRQDLEFWASYGLDVKAINNCGAKVEWENTNNLGHGKQYVRVKVPWGGYLFPSYDLNHSYVDCDVYVSMSKLKNHWLAGVTMSLKNNFGITPCSLYGGDCGPSGNENPTKERGPVVHEGQIGPPAGVPQELKPDSPRGSSYRVPRAVVDLSGVRPIDLAIVDGIQTIRGGEGEWNRGVERIDPGLLIVGRNPVCTDAVCTAVMGYDPKADLGTKPFLRGDNTLKLAEAAGLGTADLSRIEVLGLSIKEALHDFGPAP